MHAAFGVQAFVSPWSVRSANVWKVVRPKPLPVKGAAAPFAPWARFLAQTRVLHLKGRGVLCSNYSMASTALART
eukprot:7640264-Pyramimonas_sp.AAC.1